jgi:pilus assembly protein Flp/PilA
MWRLLRDDEGATMVEYGLMVALIAVVCILVIAALGEQLAASFDRTYMTIDAAGPVPATPSP